MPSQNETKDLIINKLTKEQFKTVTNANTNNEVYHITDDAHYTEAEIEELLSTKQNTLTSSNAGNGISIENGIISNTQTSAEWGNIQGDITLQSDLQSALGNKANNSEVVHLANTETISGAKTFTQPLKIQNGAGTGSLIVGADVNAGTLTNDTRKLARIVVPTLTDNTKYATLLGFDSSGDSELHVANKGQDVVSFGGQKKITNATSPMAIGFCVTNKRNSTSASDKVYVLEMDSNEARFNSRPNYNGINLATTVDVTNALGSYAKLTDIPDVSNYITMDDVEEKGYLTEHQDISNLATKTELTEGLATKQPTGNYALKSDIPDTSNLASKDEIPDTSSFITMSDVEAEGYLKGVQINDADLEISSDKKVNIPLSGTNTLGVAKANAAYGVYANGGTLTISKATDAQVTAKANQYRPIVPYNIDLAVKTGITTNTIELTDEEKSKAKEWLGISSGGGKDLFDIVQKDHILSYEETEGYELLGSYVYKEALAGSRYGYPDFYNKVVEEYNNATEIKTVKHYQSINITVVGSLTESKGVIRGFTADNYAQIPIAPPIYGDDWEYCTKIKLSNNAVISPIIATSVNYDGFQLQVNASGVLQFYLSSNGTSWNVANGLTGTTVLETNKDYWVLIKAYSVSNIYHYDVMLSTDGKTYKNEISSTIIGATVYEATTLYNIGKNHSTNIFYGSIDLKETYFTVSSVRIWEASNFLIFNFKEHSNGHKFFDIANKDAIDEYYNATGVAWFYGVDEANERILLPRNNYYFKNGDLASVGKNIEAGLPNITGKLGDTESTPMKLCNLPSGANTLQEGALNMVLESTSWSATAQQNSQTIRSLNFDASLSNPIYGNSDTVQPASVSVLAYMVVGNVKTSEGYSEVVAQGKEILEQVNEGIANGIETRANLDLSNVTQSSGLRRLIEVSDSSLMPSWYKVFEETNPATGEVKKWCEQGGIYTSSATSQEILLLKQMPSSEYLLFVQGRGNTDDTGGVAEDRNWITGASPYTNGQSTTGFRISSTTGAICFNWEAKGYIN